MENPKTGKVCWKLFEGEPQKVIEEANAFVDEWDVLKFPIAQAQTTWHDEGKRLSILLTITAPAGAGKPQLVRAMPMPQNGRGA